MLNIASSAKANDAKGEADIFHSQAKSSVFPPAGVEQK
jgi:hypothetical protein